MRLSALPDCYRDRQMGGAASAFLPSRQPSSVLNYSRAEEYIWQVGEEIPNSAVQLLGGTTLFIHTLKRHLFCYTEVRISQSQKWQKCASKGPFTSTYPTFGSILTHLCESFAFSTRTGQLQQEIRCTNDESYISTPGSKNLLPHQMRLFQSLL